jgi:hypothetical protein
MATDTEIGGGVEWLAGARVLPTDARFGILVDGAAQLQLQGFERMREK